MQALTREAALLARPAQACSSRPFSSSSVALAKKATSKGKGKKGVEVEDRKEKKKDRTHESLLADLTRPPPDLSHYRVLHTDTIAKAPPGQVLAFSPVSMSAFRTFGTPKRLKKQWDHTSRPTSVVRAATLRAWELLQPAAREQNGRIMISGSQGCGKSTVMLQMVNLALSLNWVVLYLPSTLSLVDSSSPHQYSADAQLYHQPLLSRSLSQQLLQVNKNALDALKTKTEHVIGGITIQTGEPLSALLTAPADDGAALPAVLQELASQKDRPFLVALDHAESLFASSSYVDQAQRQLETFELSIPRALLELVSGKTRVNNGLVAISHSSTLEWSNPLFAGKISKGPQSPYKQLATSIAYSELLKDVEKFDVESALSQTEAKGLFEQLIDRRGIRAGAPTDELFFDRYLAASGNARELARGLIEDVVD